MTNAIEQTKREMYEALAILKGRIEINYSIKDMQRGADEFDSALEDYLEQVRQDHEGLHETARKRFEDVQTLEAGNEKLSKALRHTNETIQRCAAHSLEAIRGLEAQLAEMTRMREVYYKLACDYTTKSVDLEKRLCAMTEERDAIQLRLHAIDHAYNEQQRKAGTSGQVCADRVASEQPDAHMAVVMAAVRGAQDIMVEYLVPDGIRAKRAMTKLIPLLDNEKLYSALYEIEHAEGKS